MSSLLGRMKSFQLASKVAFGVATGAVFAFGSAAIGSKIVVCAEEGVCPVKHNVAKENVCPVKHDAVVVVKDVNGQEVCPVKHDNGLSKVSAADISADGAVCPVKKGTPSSSSYAAAVDDVPAVCPMRETTGSASHGSYILGRVKREPGNTSDSFVKKSAAVVHEEDGLDYNKAKIEHADEIPGMPIPASGRGNSDDGSHWVNPSPAQLFRALRRNKKIIDEEDAYSVAFIHGAVVDNTWDEIMKFESLHQAECNDITLKKFQGMYGHHTLKSYFTHKLNGLEPFDRHDWVVNRCGTDVRYIIDYYAQTTAEGEVYSIDARPDLTRLGNIKDRLTLAFDRYKKGESVW